MSNSQIVLLAHGSRDARWRVPFESLITSMKDELGEDKVSLAYLEFCSPSIEEIVEQGYKDGFTELKFLPLFMAAGAHLRNDVPKILTELKKDRKDLELSMLEPIGEHQLIVNAISGIIRENLTEVQGLSV